MTNESWTELALLLKERDPQLAPVISHVGAPTIRLERDRFRALAESILSQQLATKAAKTIIERFRQLSPPFPKPGEIAKWTPAKMRKAGVSGQKAAYLCALSKHWLDPKWRRGWDKLADEALVERLTEVKGIGEWTAHMFLIFSVGRPDVLPVGDFGVRRGIQLLRGLPSMPLPKEIPALVPQWKGASSVGAWYMWRALDLKLLTK